MESAAASAPTSAPSTSTDSSTNQAIPNSSSETSAAEKGETAAQAEARKWKLKVNGKEREVTEEELLSGYNRAEAAEERFKEAAMTKKQAEEFVNMLKKDPIALLKDPRLGHDVRMIAEKYLLEQMQEEMLTPEQKELKEAKAKLKAYEDQKRAIEQEQMKARDKELTEKYTADYSNQIIKALNENSLPKTEYTVKRIAYYMHLGLQKGLNLSASDVADKVKQDYINEQKALFAAADGGTLVQLLGEDAANKLRKWDVSRVKNPNAHAKTPEKQFISDDTPKKTKKITIDEWRARLEKIKNSEE
jgi:hypothetical protein